MTLREMLERATPDSLVLVDELGARPILKKAGRWAWPCWRHSRKSRRVHAGVDTSDGDESLRSIDGRRAQRIHGIR